MEGHRTVARVGRRVRTPVRLHLAVAALVAAGMTLGAWIAFRVAPGAVGLLGLLVVGPTLLAGERARWGVVLGVLAAGAVAGDWPGGVALALAAFVAGTVCARLGPIRAEPVPRWLAANGGVAVVAVVALAATAGFLAELLATGAFAVRFVETLRSTLPAALAGLPLVWALDRRVGPTPPSTRPRDRWPTVGIVLGWGAAGFAASVVLQSFDRDPAVFVGRRIDPLARTALESVGGGRGALLLLGVLALAALGTVGRSS